MVPVIRLHRTVSKIMNLMNKKKLITILLTLVAMAGLGQELKIDGKSQGQIKRVPTSLEDFMEHMAMYGYWFSPI